MSLCTLDRNYTKKAQKPPLSVIFFDFSTQTAYFITKGMSGVIYLKIEFSKNFHQKPKGLVHAFFEAKK